VSDGTELCTGTVASGQCTLTFSAAGNYNLVATYSGDNNYNSSTSSPEPHTVGLANTYTVIVSDDPDPSAPGEPVMVHYAIGTDAPLPYTPTGTITVSDGTDSCTGNVVSGECSLTLTGSPGTYNLVATYSGDSNYNGSTSAPEPHTLGPIKTSTSITSDDPDPSLTGRPVTVQYTASTPTGTVTVTDGTDSCTGTVADGQCTLTITVPGNWGLVATYSGDSSYGGSTSFPEPHSAQLGFPQTQILSDDPDPSVVGQVVTVKYTVLPDQEFPDVPPTGTVTVSDGPDSCTGTVADGQCAITFSSVGSSVLTATYSGDLGYLGSVSDAEPHMVILPPNNLPTASVSGGACSATNTASGSLNLTLLDADGDPLTLTLASNSNTGLVPNSSIQLGGSGYKRTLTVTAKSKKSETATLTFNLSDGKDAVQIVVTVRVGTDASETLNGTSGIDMIFGRNGNNTINGSGDSDLLCGGNGIDTLSGQDGNDILGGQNGDDILDGGTGNDTLNGNAGDDRLTGGADADLFSGGAGTDQATDFNTAEGDTQDGTIP
jgi:Ca2+-binding RTX toxin-like protein